MIINDREILFSEKFFDDFLSIEEYFNTFSSAKAKKTTKQFFDFATDTVATFPQAFPKYEYYQRFDFEYRKAVFQKSYILIYRLNDSKVEFLRIYHASQDPRNIKL
jgi:plasmid stabilization system protein ParE